MARILSVRGGRAKNSSHCSIKQIGSSSSDPIKCRKSILMGALKLEGCGVMENAGGESAAPPVGMEWKWHSAVPLSWPAAGNHVSLNTPLQTVPSPVIGFRTAVSPLGRSVVACCRLSRLSADIPCCVDLVDFVFVFSICSSAFPSSFSFSPGLERARFTK